jgi:hypothetical protein
MPDELSASTGSFYIFGGGVEDATGRSMGLGDSWFFDGTRWTEANVSGRLPLSVIVPFGGELVGIQEVDPGPVDATWTFGGTSWSQLGEPAPFPPRVLTTMAVLP